MMYDTVNVADLLIDEPDMDAPALVKGWNTLSEAKLYDLLDVIGISQENGGSYFDGEMFEPLTEAVEAELDYRGTWTLG